MSGETELHVKNSYRFWWAWILAGIVAFWVFLLFLRSADDPTPASPLIVLLFCLSGAAALCCLLIGIIRLIKWAWLS